MNPTEARALSNELERAASSGRVTEALRVLEALAAAQPTVRWAVEQLRIYARAHDWEPAIAQAKIILELRPDSASVWMQLANLLAAAERLDGVVAAVEEAVARAPGSEAVRLEAARLCCDVGAFDAARVHAEAAAVLGGDGDLVLGRLAVWSGDDDGALRHAERADGRASDVAGAPVLRALVALERGEHEAMKTLAAKAVALDETCVEALVLSAEAALYTGDFQRVGSELNRALNQARSYIPSAWLVRQLWMATTLGVSRDVDEIREVIGELAPGTRALPDLSHDERREVLRRVLAAMRGNRSVLPTFLRDGKLHRVAARNSPRHASRHALDLIRTASPARTLAALDNVVARFPHSSLPLAHRAELHLWLGDGERARADFERAIVVTKITRFAYIGLAGVELLADRPEEALKVLAIGTQVMDKTDGPAAFAYRGEALRRLGRLEEARREFDAALAARPGRASSWVNLALVRDRLGDAEGARAAFREAVALAEPIFEDATKDVLGHAPENDAERTRVLETVLVMMRGNRSSSRLTYFTSAGELRSIENRAKG